MIALLLALAPIWTVPLPAGWCASHQCEKLPKPGGTSALHTHSTLHCDMNAQGQCVDYIPDWNYDFYEQKSRWEAHCVGLYACTDPDGCKITDDGETVTIVATNATCTFRRRESR